MKRFIVTLALTIAVLTGCNRQIVDTTWVYEYAMIILPDGIIEGEISSWRDYDVSDMVQVKFKDGTTYLTHSTNVILISGGNYQIDVDISKEESK